MANPITILIEQAGQPAGTPGASRDDLIVGALCTCTDPANSGGGGTWAWDLIVPNGSSTIGSGESTDTFTFTPDKPGTYLVYLAYDDGTEVLSYTVDALGQRLSTQGGGGVKDGHGYRFTGFAETQQFGTRGWDPAVDAILRAVAANNVLVLRPGGTAGGSVFTDFASLYDVLSSLEGPSTILMDNSAGAITLPAGSGAYDMTGVEWVGTRPYGETTVTIGEGATFVKFRRIRNLHLINASTSSPISDFSDWESFEMWENAWCRSDTGKAPLFSFASVTPGTYGNLECHDSGLGNGADAVVSAPAGVHVGISLYNEAFLNKNTVSASATLAIYTYGTNARFHPTQTSFSGTINWTSLAAESLQMVPGYGQPPSTTNVGLQGGYFARYNATAGQISQTMPLIGGTTLYESASRKIVIKEYSGVNGVLLNRYGANTVNGGTSYLVPAGHSATFISDGINDWTLIAVTNAGGASDPDAIHDNVSGEINAIAAKSPVVAADQLLIEDSADSNNKKKALVSALRITESQVTDLSHTDANAIHDNVAAEISAVAEKATPVSADLLLIEDSADSNNKKRVQVGNLPGGSGTDPDAIHDNVAGEIAAVAAKTPLVGADYFLVEDSADTNAKKSATVADIRITESQVTDLDHTDPDAIHDDVAGEIDALSPKSPLVAADQLLIEDSADSNNKKKALVSALRITESQVTDLSHTDANAIHDNVAAEISAVAEKATPVSADLLLIEDSADSNNKKRVQVGNLPGGGSTTAEALGTTGSDVNVGSAAPPTTGQILKATSATTATWQTVPTGFGAATEKLINTLRAGDVASHDSATPLVVSQFAFDPSEYSLTGCTRSLVFRAVAANGGGVAQTKARLYSVTDAEYIGSGVTFTSASPTKQQETLTIGSGAGEVDDSEKVYEVHVWVVSPDGVDDTIELGSAELRMINTIN